MISTAMVFRMPAHPLQVDEVLPSIANHRNQEFSPTFKQAHRIHSLGKLVSFPYIEWE